MFIKSKQCVDNEDEVGQEKNGEERRRAGHVEQKRTITFSNCVNVSLSLSLSLFMCNKSTKSCYIMTDETQAIDMAMRVVGNNVFFSHTLNLCVCLCLAVLCCVVRIHIFIFHIDIDTQMCINICLNVKCE